MSAQLFVHSCPLLKRVGQAGAAVPVSGLLPVVVQTVAWVQALT